MQGAQLASSRADARRPACRCATLRTAPHRTEKGADEFVGEFAWGRDARGLAAGMLAVDDRGVHVRQRTGG